VDNTKTRLHVKCFAKLLPTFEKKRYTWLCKRYCHFRKRISISLF